MDDEILWIPPTYKHFMNDWLLYYYLEKFGLKRDALIFSKRDSSLWWRKEWDRASLVGVGEESFTMIKNAIQQRFGSYDSNLFCRRRCDNQASIPEVDPPRPESIFAIARDFSLAATLYGHTDMVVDSDTRLANLLGISVPSLKKMRSGLFPSKKSRTKTKKIVASLAVNFEKIGFVPYDVYASFGLLDAVNNFFETGELYRAYDFKAGTHFEVLKAGVYLGRFFVSSARLYHYEKFLIRKILKDIKTRHASIRRVKFLLRQKHLERCRRGIEPRWPVRSWRASLPDRKPVRKDRIALRLDIDWLFCSPLRKSPYGRTFRLVSRPNSCKVAGRKWPSTFTVEDRSYVALRPLEHGKQEDCSSFASINMEARSKFELTEVVVMHPGRHYD